MELRLNPKVFFKLLQDAASYFGITLSPGQPSPILKLDRFA